MPHSCPTDETPLCKRGPRDLLELPKVHHLSAFSEMDGVGTTAELTRSVTID